MDDVPVAPREYTNFHLYRALRLTVETYYKSSGNPGKKAAATGFVLKPWDPSQPGYLVTNRHVLDPPFHGGADNLDRTVGDLTVTSYSPNDPQKQPLAVTLREVKPTFLDARPDLDLAVIDLKSYLQGDELPFAFSITDLVTPDDIRRDHVGAGSEIVMPGYPVVDGIAGERPVLVSGRVSSDLRTHATLGESTYTDQGLCHTFSRGGMSGAPVLTAVDQPPDREGRPQAAAVQVLGVNVGHIKFGTDEMSVISRFLPSPALLAVLREVDDGAAQLWSML